MNEIVCNYTIARFRPYPETGEFVNVGLVLVCPQLHYFGYQFEQRKYGRITAFFPELDIDVFRSGLRGLRTELARIAGPDADDAGDQLVLRETANSATARFQELVRPRESLFQFGEIATVLSADPRQKLRELFQHYIERQFAQDREYQEKIMRGRLAKFLRENELLRHYRTDLEIGDDSYHVKVPFAHQRGDTTVKAIKPLHLDKSDATRIYRHGDAWVSSVKRLRKINRLPKEWLFTVKTPTGNKRCQEAAREICSELQSHDTLIVPFADTNRILEFARV